MEFRQPILPYVPWLGRQDRCLAEHLPLRWRAARNKAEARTGRRSVRRVGRAPGLQGGRMRLASGVIAHARAACQAQPNVLCRIQNRAPLTCGLESMALG